MVISVSDTFQHTTPCEKKVGSDEKEIQQAVLNLIEKIGINPNEVRWNNQGHLELPQSNKLKFHTLTLEMEKLGLDLKMTRQTLIEVC